MKARRKNSILTTFFWKLAKNSVRLLFNLTKSDTVFFDLVNF